jgi:hypothetical protein
VVSFIVSFPSEFNNSLLPCLLPAFGGSNALEPVRPGCRESSRIPPVPVFPWPLFPDGVGPILSLSVPSGAPCGSWFGPERWPEAVVGRSVKLVHRPFEAGEAGMCSWPRLPVSDPRPSCAARCCRSAKPPLLSTCPCQVPARSYDGSPCANPCRGGRHFYRATSP